METKTWEKTSERFIAVIDLMGIDDFIRKKDHLSVKRRIDIFHHILIDSVKSLKESMKEDYDYDIEEVLKFTFYSETILIVANDDSEFSLQNLLIACQVIVASCIFDRIPVRGVISYGTITADFTDSFFFGRALLDAPKVIDHMYMYGVVIDNRVEKQMKEHLNNVVADHCILGKVHTRSGMIRYYSINWMEIAARISHINPELLLNNFYIEVSGDDRKYLDNTIEFYQTLPKEVSSSIGKILSEDQTG
ncbi:MAG: hypothetical protein RLN81_13930, partial [Balneolaceae bacterium]